MSKMDAQRAMREANYAARQGTGAKRRDSSASSESVAPTPASKQARRPATTSTKPAVVNATDAAAESCGHKSMNGRACTREAGHSEKSHRYS